MKRMIVSGIIISMLALLAGCGNSENAPEISGQGSGIRQNETLSSESGGAAFDETDAGEKSEAGGKTDAAGEPDGLGFGGDGDGAPGLHAAVGGGDDVGLP